MHHIKRLISRKNIPTTKTWLFCDDPDSPTGRTFRHFHPSFYQDDEMLKSHEKDIHDIAKKIARKKMREKEREGLPPVGTPVWVYKCELMHGSSKHSLETQIIKLLSGIEDEYIKITKLKCYWYQRDENGKAQRYESTH